MYDFKWYSLQFCPGCCQATFLRTVSPTGCVPRLQCESTREFRVELISFNSRSKKELILVNLLGHPVGQFQDQVNSQCSSIAPRGPWLLGFASPVGMLSLGREPEAGPAEKERRVSGRLYRPGHGPSFPALYPPAFCFPSTRFRPCSGNDDSDHQHHGHHHNQHHHSD